MNRVLEYWYLIVFILAVLSIGAYYIRKFRDLSTEQQLDKVKEWLLYAVILAEKEFKNGTGQLKLRYVWSLFLEKFPSLAKIISFELFSALVDEVLDEMKRILESNKDIAMYVEGE